MRLDAFKKLSAETRSRLLVLFDEYIERESEFSSEYPDDWTVEDLTYTFIENCL